jgi:hypothetical protein
VSATAAATADGVQAVGTTLGIVRGAEDADAPAQPSESLAPAPAPGASAVAALYAWRLRYEVLLGLRANRAGFAPLSPPAPAPAPGASAAIAPAELEPPFPKEMPAALRSARGAALLDGAMARVEELLALAAAAFAWPERSTDTALLSYAQVGLAADLERRRGLPFVMGGGGASADDAAAAAGGGGDGGGGGDDLSSDPDGAGAEVQCLVDSFLDAALASIGARTERARGFEAVDKAVDAREAANERATRIAAQAVEAADGGSGIVRAASRASYALGVTRFAVGRGVGLIVSSLPGAGVALLVANEVEQLNEAEKKRQAHLARRAVFVPLAREAYITLLNVLAVIARLPASAEVAVA